MLRLLHRTKRSLHTLTTLHSISSVPLQPKLYYSVPKFCIQHRFYETSSRTDTHEFSEPFNNDLSEDNDLSVDVAIVGAGPAGLSTALRLKQLNQDLEIIVLEKSAEIGGHIVSGNVFDTRSLDELLPGWRKGLKASSDSTFSSDSTSSDSLSTTSRTPSMIDDDLFAPSVFPFRTPVTADSFQLLLSPSLSFECPSILLPPALQNAHHGKSEPHSFVVSLSEVCRWLSSVAEQQGITVLTSAAAARVLLDGEEIRGVRLRDDGIDKMGRKSERYEKGMRILCRQLVLAEGCRGSLSEFIKSNFSLLGSSSPQRYGLGLKEVWEVQSELHTPGLVTHTVGWPLDYKTFGGGFVYHQTGPSTSGSRPLVHIGMVIGLDYKNPWMNPYEEFQQFKHHPVISKLLKGGKRLSYGARCINEGGLQAIPEKLDYPGGVLVGCSAGFVNVPRIKGVHTAMKTGIVAAEWLNEKLEGRQESSFAEALRNSWVWKELNEVRNVKPCFSLPGGLCTGLVASFLQLWVTRGREPWTIRWTTTDSQMTGLKTEFPIKEYQKHDGVLSFDLTENLSFTNVNHNPDQPSHLKVKESHRKVADEESWDKFGGPESRFCPAEVYKFVQSSPSERPKLEINAQNCIHCKSCSIKTPKEYIRWTVPEGGGGPNYHDL